MMVGRWNARAWWPGILALGLVQACGGDTGPLGSSSTAGGTGGGGSGGAGATGGTGGATTVCAPGEVKGCPYSGDPATLGKGSCAAGEQICDPDGLAFGPCHGEVLPEPEVCGNGVDEDCDGVADQGCVCAPGATQACYSGPAGTMGVGACKAGIQVCDADGLSYGPCAGEVLPGTEDCDASMVDEDCDGQVNEDGPSCVCVPGSDKACYSGPPATLGVGACTAGTQACDADGLGYGPCTGEVTPQIEACGGGADVDCDGASPALCPGQHLWSKGFVSPGGAQGNGVAVDAAGDIVLAGWFAGSVDFGGGALASAGSKDIVLAKYGPTGQHLWSKRFGSTLGDEARGVAVDAAGNLVVAGYFQGTVDFGGGPLTSAGSYDVVVAKYTPSGQHLWSKRIGGSLDDGAIGVAVDPAGSVLLAGYFQGTVDLGGGPLASAGDYDGFVAKLDASGQHVWSRRFGGALLDLGFAIATTAAGDVVLTGGFQGTVDLGGGPLTSAGSEDVFLARYDVSGQHLWSKRFGGSGLDRGQGVAVDAAGNVHLTGRIGDAVDLGGGVTAGLGQVDSFVARYDASGAHLWSKRLGSPGVDGGVGVAVDAAGNVAVTGLFGGPADLGGGVLPFAGNEDIYVAKYGPSGQHLWSKGFGGANVEYGLALALDAAADVVTTGPLGGAVDFGGGPLGAGMFLVKLAP